MKHIGDITKINGKLIDPVDVITGGSPCQDLSVAGLRKGLAGQRSGLFMEQIRIIKEMREATNGKQPRFMVWENVPGAFSSNKGEDFRCVLEETARVADQDAVVPGLEGKQRWTPSGCIMGDGWSIAWRVHDAQFWGVPQRRKRISLVADFAGGGAPEILFEREGMPGDTETSGKEREGIAGDFRESTQDASWIVALNEQGGSEPRDNLQTVCYSIGGYNSEGMLSENPNAGIYEAETSRTLDLNGGNPACNQGGMMVVQSCTEHHAVCIGNGQINDAMNPDYEVSKTLNCLDDPMKIVVEEPTMIEMCGPLVIQNPIVRRLTPMECERLQGFPDGWTDIGDWLDSKGKKHKGESDSPRYKALGNSIALPFWRWMAERMVRYIPRHATMGSLFDGIGGFPLAFQRCGCEPVWASEIEEFCIAVTNKRFNEVCHV